MNSSETTSVSIEQLSYFSTLLTVIFSNAIQSRSLILELMRTTYCPECVPLFFFGAKCNPMFYSKCTEQDTSQSETVKKKTK